MEQLSTKSERARYAAVKPNTLYKRLGLVNAHQSVGCFVRPSRGNVSRVQKNARVGPSVSGFVSDGATFYQVRERGTLLSSQTRSTNGSSECELSLRGPETLKSASEIFQRVRRVPCTARVDLRANAPNVTEAELDRSRSNKTHAANGSTDACVDEQAG